MGERGIGKIRSLQGSLFTPHRKGRSVLLCKSRFCVGLLLSCAILALLSPAYFHFKIAKADESQQIVISNVSTSAVTSVGSTVSFDTSNPATADIQVCATKYSTYLVSGYIGTNCTADTNRASGNHVVNITSLAEGTVYVVKISARNDYHSGQADQDQIYPANSTVIKNYMHNTGGEYLISGNYHRYISLSGGFTITDTESTPESPSKFGSRFWSITTNGWGRTRLFDLGIANSRIYVNDDGNPTYSYGVWLKAAAGSEGQTANLELGVDSGLTFLRSCTLTAAWQFCSASTAPAGTYSWVSFSVQTNNALTFYMDGVVLEQSPSFSAAYIDGDQPASLWLANLINPDTGLKYSAQSAPQAGLSESIHPAFYTLQADSSPEISTVAVNNITSTSAAITWSTSDIANGKIEVAEEKDISLSATGYQSFTEGLGTDYRVGSHSVSLTGLDPGKTYYYKITSTNSKGTDIFESTKNLVPVGGFESIEKYYNPWSANGSNNVSSHPLEEDSISYWSSSGDIISIVDSPTKYGEKALRGIFPINQQYVSITEYGGWNGAKATIPIDPTQTYTYSLWVKGNAADLYLKVIFNAGDGIVQATPITSSDLTDWKKFSYTITPADIPDNATSVGIRIGNLGDASAERTVYIDGVQFEQKAYATHSVDPSICPDGNSACTFYWDAAGEDYAAGYQNGRQYASASGIVASFNTTNAFGLGITSVENIGNNGSVKISWQTSVASTTPNNAVEYGQTTDYEKAAANETCTDQDSTHHSCTITGLHRVPLLYNNAASAYTYNSTTTGTLQDMNGKVALYYFKVKSIDSGGNQALETTSHDTAYVRDIQVGRPEDTSAQMLVRTNKPSDITIKYQAKVDGVNCDYNSLPASPSVSAGGSTESSNGLFKKFTGGVFEDFYVYKATISGLTASTEYCYQMTAENQTSFNNSNSGTYKKGDIITDTFHTKLAAGSNFSFATINDIQGWSANRVVDQLNTWNPDLLFSVGDIGNMYEDNIDQTPAHGFDYEKAVNQFQAYSSQLKKVTDHSVYAFQQGNHEDWGNCSGSGISGCQNLDVFNQMTTFPGDLQGEINGDVDTNYSFDYGDAHFVSFSDGYCSNASTKDTCLAWLQSDLSNSTKKWKIVISHVPVRGGASAMTTTIWSQLHDIYKANGVNLVITGHQHIYNRFFADGVYYIVSPSGSFMGAVAPFQNDGTAVNNCHGAQGNSDSASFPAGATIPGSFGFPCDASENYLGGTVKFTVNSDQITGSLYSFNRFDDNAHTDDFVINPTAVTATSSTGSDWSNNASPTISWPTASTNTTVGMSKYQLYVDGTLTTDNIAADATSTTISGLSDGMHSWYVQAVDNTASYNASTNIGRTTSVEGVIKVDGVSPALTLAFPISTTLSTTSSSLTITGSATDSHSGIASLSVNGVSISNPSSFSATASLNLGLNTITIVVVDNVGNTSSQALTVTRTAPGSISSIINSTSRALAQAETVVTDDNAVSTGDDSGSASTSSVNTTDGQTAKNNTNYLFWIILSLVVLIILGVGYKTSRRRA